MARSHCGSRNRQDVTRQIFHEGRARRSRLQRGAAVHGSSDHSGGLLVGERREYCVSLLRWPCCYSTLCPPIRSLPNGSQAALLCEFPFLDYSARLVFLQKDDEPPQRTGPSPL